MTKKKNECFKNSTKCYICDNVYINIIVRNRCYITGKYRGFAPENCNIKVKLCHKTLAVSHNLKI